MDHFTYRLTDGSSGSAMATVIIVVETEDPLPEACEKLGGSREIHVLCSVLRLLPAQSQPEIERIIERYSDDDQGLEIEFKRRRGDRWELTIRLSEGDFALSHRNERDKIRIDLDSELEDEWRYWDEFLERHQASEADDD